MQARHPEGQCNLPGKDQLRGTKQLSYLCALYAKLIHAASTKGLNSEILVQCCPWHVCRPQTVNYLPNACPLWIFKISFLRPS